MSLFFEETYLPNIILCPFRRFLRGRRIGFFCRSLGGRELRFGEIGFRINFGGGSLDGHEVDHVESPFNITEAPLFRRAFPYVGFRTKRPAFHGQILDVGRRSVDPEGTCGVTCPPDFSDAWL